jgi:hypothetical protein
VAEHSVATLKVNPAAANKADRWTRYPVRSREPQYLPMPAFLGRAHLRVSGSVLVLGGGRRADQHDVHNGACAQPEPPGLQVLAHTLEDLFAQAFALQQMAEPAHRRLVGHALQSLVYGGAVVEASITCFRVAM